MRRGGPAIVVALLLAVPALAMQATAEPPMSPGPFVGTVEEDQTVEHRFDNRVPGAECVQIVAPYEIVLTHAPASDTLTLSIGEQENETEDGLARLTVKRSPCTSFEIRVEGTEVADEAHYAVEVLGPAFGADLVETPT